MNPKTIFSTALLPNIDYMVALLSANSIVIEQNESYKKQSYRNRYCISGPNGLQTLTIPVDKNGLHNCPIKDLRISYDTDWLKLHWKSWETAYNSSPFFLYYKDDFKIIFDKKYKFLWDLNRELLALILSLLGIEKSIGYTTQYIKNYENEIDLRDKINPKRNPLINSFLEYHQVFIEKNSFIPNLSIIDLLFNLGNESTDYLVAI